MDNNKLSEEIENLITQNKRLLPQAEIKNNIIQYFGVSLECEKICADLLLKH